jgi:hypothetical protein
MALPQEALVQGMHGFSASGLEAEFKIRLQLYAAGRSDRHVPVNVGW